jgi:hypothetical protein
MGISFMKPHKPIMKHDYVEDYWILDVKPNSLVDVCYVLEEHSASIFTEKGQV